MSREAVSISEAAKLLDVSRWTIYRLVKDGQLETFLVRHTQRIALSELRRFKQAAIVARRSSE